MDDGDGTLLGRDDHDDGVSFLGEANGSPMPRSQGATDERVGRQGQEASCSCDAAPLDDQRPIVNGGLGHEDAGDELSAHARVQNRADFDVILETDLAFENDKRPDTASGVADRPDFSLI